MLKDFYSSVLTDKQRLAFRALHLGFREFTEIIQIRDMSADEFFMVLNAYQRENPMVYWVNFHSGVPAMSSGSNVFIKPPYQYKDKLREIDAAFQKACREIPSHPNNPRLQIMAIVEWMTRLRYVNTGKEHEHNVAGPLLYGEGVCEAFSQLFQAFCDHFNVDCMVALGTVTGMADGHAWNVIGYGGKCYNVDMTQAIAVRQNVGISLYNVMVPDYIISDYHPFDKPYCGVLSDNPYFLDDKAFTSEEDLIRMVKKGLATRKPFTLFDASKQPLDVASIIPRFSYDRSFEYNSYGRMWRFFPC